MLGCSEDAAERGKTTSALDGAIVSTELIEWNGAICDPAVKAESAIRIYAGAIVQYACCQAELRCHRKHRSLHVVFSGDLEDFAMETRTWAV